MKNLNRILLALIISSFSSYFLTKSQNNLGLNPIASNIDYTVYTEKIKLKRTNPLEFQPDEAFGGAQAQGQYNYKNKTAEIIDAKITYSFQRVQELPNPEQPDNKNSEHLIRFGSFINGITKGMPITRYLFGELVKNSNHPVLF